ncbi:MULTISPECIES: IclR family transcriptional regulator [unclassified Cryobacterium]|uniref:IclR family transcriptional regulator n=1 Tax=unclassified Cryobacterium TaxID=2649013 RepID=UPI002AB552B3|nr:MULTISPECIES: helix-turn-helix domain-containing protein [unclassified Cryobacterium]MDY7542070.1 helix-turn-helix domain-containing protein [Cryobacterium sp. 5B3]MEB0266168.1 helix-turn-helix domain-containing protein [Cryobacterium sp. 10I5]MEB0275491.1 helix-turn-helix domain-containing protein [Cryobacterium sp. 5B3]
MTGAAHLGARQPKAIQSALTVLEEVARCGSGVTAREISDSLGLPKATAYRLLNLLVQDEYLVRMPDLRGFALGRKVVELARLVAPAQPPEAVREVVDRLRSRIRGGIHLVRYDSDGVRVIDPDPDYPPSVSVRSARALETSAMGRLLLAERRGDSAMLGEDPELAGQLATIRIEGYAYCPSSWAPGTGCLAIPIRNREGSLVAGLCLSAPAARIDEPAEFLALLRMGARELAPLLA